MYHKPHLREVEEEEREDAEKEARVDGYIDPLPVAGDFILQLYGKLLFVFGIVFFILLLVLIPYLIKVLVSPLLPIISAGVIVVMTSIIGARIERQNVAILPTFILLLIIFAAFAVYSVVNSYIYATIILIFLVITGILVAVRLYNSAIIDK